MVFTDATQGLFFAGTLQLWDSISGHTGGQMDILLRGRGQRCPSSPTHRTVMVVVLPAPTCFSSLKAQHRMPPQTQYLTDGGSHNASICAQLSGPGRTTWMRMGSWGLFQLAGRHGKQANTGTQYKDPQPFRVLLSGIYWVAYRNFSVVKAGSLRSGYQQGSTLVRGPFLQPHVAWRPGGKQANSEGLTIMTSFNPSHPTEVLTS